MKKLLLCMMFAPTMASAQAISQEDMDAMMAAAAQMQACLQNVDQGAIKQLEQEQKVFMQKVKGVCAQGKRDDAQDMAMEYAKDVMKSPELVKIRECTESVKMPESMKGMMPDMSVKTMEKELSKHHVCDDI